ncbi:endonuclease/exonuclease/phosphatase family protein [Fontisubflavum oceani]|uniref:endonuclease/exonuclease/phosphatase family protein n=1 Tax=Fontisubflavum oceani TaxID=2978973 RepID=UPI0025B5E131|nr:endonuclease/exonuclease/phosphatase family protein [Fontisubflavum oceani]WJY23041.1 endonuclease/exonuclease/phosphatase family protein [Fontisubflavum oceani]
MEFTLATFNTYWLYDNEAPLARWGLKLPDGGLKEKVDQVAKAIIGVGESGADVVALQEVEGPHVIDALMQRLSELSSPIKYYWCSETLDPFTGQNVAVLSKFPATIQPVLRLDQTVVPYSDHRGFERMGSLGKFMRVDLEIDGQVLSLFNVHFKSRRGGVEETRLLRTVQAQIVRNLTRPRVEQGNSRSPSFTAIAGDFNDTPKSVPIDTVLGKHDTSYQLFSVTQTLPAEDQWTYVFDGENQQLDHVLLSKFAHDRMLASGIARVPDEVSDHDIVWAKINLSLPSN